MPDVYGMDAKYKSELFSFLFGAKESEIELLHNIKHYQNFHHSNVSSPNDNIFENPCKCTSC